MRFLLQAACVILIKGGVLSASIGTGHKYSTRAEPYNIIDTDQLKTWWHATGEINTQTSVRPENVRQSHLYTIQVATSPDGPFYDSFVYESIPRGGKAKATDTGDDGVSIEADVGITMAWSQFVYSTTSYVKVLRSGTKKASAGDVIIRPTTLMYDISKLDDSIIIKIPFGQAGSRFSIEFQDDLYTYHSSCTGTQCGFVQSESPTGAAYVSQYTDQMPIVSVEPKNALMIFASPPLPSDLTPDMTSSDALQPQTGLVKGLDATTSSTIIFNPGVYYMTATAHAQLSSSVAWVYFAPGAYIKGAIQFKTSSQQIKCTGYGVLSGEEYVYQANVKEGYRSVQSNEDDLRMWSGVSVDGTQQVFTLVGPTINEQPFNSMDFTGDLDSLSVVADQYKQVGAWYGQTDGLEAYPGSHISNSFFHANDDTIKTYYSNVVVENIVVWKGTTAPTIQFGWHSRSISNILVQNIDIIHSRYTSNSSHPSLIGANQEYLASESATNTGDSANTIQDYTIKNIRSEGISGNLFRIVALENIQRFTIENVAIEKFPLASMGIQDSELPLMTDNQGKTISVSDFKIIGFTVGGGAVSSMSNNWQSGRLGALNIPSSLIQNGDVSIS